MDAVIAMGMLGGLVAAAYGVGRWILGPIDRAAKVRGGRGRVSIGDLLCLFIVVQLPLTVVSRLQGEDTDEYFWIFTALAWIVAPIIWIACAVTLSRARITRGSHRVVFMGFVLPVVYYGLTPFFVLTIAAAEMIRTGHGAEIVEHLWSLVAWIGTAAALIVSGLYTNWLVKHPCYDETASRTKFESGSPSDGSNRHTQPVLTIPEP